MSPIYDDCVVVDIDITDRSVFRFDSQNLRFLGFHEVSFDSFRMYNKI